MIYQTEYDIENLDLVLAQLLLYSNRVMGEEDNIIIEFLDNIIIEGEEQKIKTINMKKNKYKQNIKGNAENSE